MKNKLTANMDKHIGLSLLLLALSLTFFGCSSSDDNDKDPLPSMGEISSSSGGSSSNGNSEEQSSSSSSSNGEEQSSSSSSNSETQPITKAKITGISQKGPFVKGSTAKLYELNDNFVQTGRSFQDIIVDDYGNFEIKGIELASPYAMLEANGFYRNEVTGQKSSAPITLYAIADIREKDNININLLTHLEYYRVLNLVEDGETVAEAKKQAQKEILAVFGINGDNFKDSEDMSIFGTSEGDAALLAISVLLQGNLSEADFSERLADFRLSIQKTGNWSNEKEKAAIAKWVVERDGAGEQYSHCCYGKDNCWPMPTDDMCSSGTLTKAKDCVMDLAEAGVGEISYCRYYNDNNNCWPMPTDDMCSSGTLVKAKDCGIYYTSTASKMSAIKNNILAWALSSNVPDFGKYVNIYWVSYYGIETCGISNEGEIKKLFVFGEFDNRDFICKNNQWEYSAPQLPSSSSGGSGGGSSSASFSG